MNINRHIYKYHHRRPSSSYSLAAEQKRKKNYDGVPWALQGQSLKFQHQALTHSRGGRKG